MFVIQRTKDLIGDIILAEVTQEKMKTFCRKLVVELYQWRTHKQQNGNASDLEK